MRDPNKMCKITDSETVSPGRKNTTNRDREPGRDGTVNKENDPTLYAERGGNRRKEWGENVDEKSSLEEKDSRPGTLFVFF